MQNVQLLRFFFFLVGGVAHLHSLQLFQTSGHRVVDERMAAFLSGAPGLGRFSCLIACKVNGKQPQMSLHLLLFLNCHSLKLDNSPPSCMSISYQCFISSKSSCKIVCIVIHIHSISFHCLAQTAMNTKEFISM